MSDSFLTASSNGFRKSAVLLINDLVPLFIFCHAVGWAVFLTIVLPVLGHILGTFQPLPLSLTRLLVGGPAFFANGLRLGMLQPPSAKAGGDTTSSAKSVAKKLRAF